jgi:hypothetical protein
LISASPTPGPSKLRKDRSNVFQASTSGSRFNILGSKDDNDDNDNNDDSDNNDGNDTPRTKGNNEDPTPTDVVTPYASPLPNPPAKVLSLRKGTAKTPGPSKKHTPQPSSVDYEAIKEKHRKNGVEESEAEPSDEYKESTHDSNDDEADTESSASGPPAKKRAKRRGGKAHKRKVNTAKQSNTAGPFTKTQQNYGTLGPVSDEDSEGDRDRRRRQPAKLADSSSNDAAMDVEPRRTKPLPSKGKRVEDTEVNDAQFVADMRGAAIALISRRLEASVEAAKSRESEDDDDDNNGSISEAEERKQIGGYKRGRWSRQEMGKAEGFYAYGVKLANGLNRPLGSLVKKSG